MTPELINIDIRKSIFFRLRAYRDHEYRDTGLLYLGARYALSLGWREEAADWLDMLSSVWTLQETDEDIFLPVIMLKFLTLPIGNDRDEMKKQIERLFQKHRPEGIDPDMVYFDDVTKKSVLGDIWQTEFEKYKTKHKLSVLGDTQSTISPREIENILQGTTQTERISNILYLSSIANQCYQNRNIDMARYVLEKMLLIDGNQPEVLRNLIIISSEQRDIEAFERYWRRYVKLLLWNYFTTGEQNTSAEALVKFYERIITLLERDSGQPIDKMIELLNRPGFLNRWVEALAGLIWLTNLNKIAAPLAKKNLSANRFHDYSPLANYWLKTFYPEFVNKFKFVAPAHESDKKRIQLPRETSKINLSFSPELKFVSAYLTWGRFNFGLRTGESSYLKETIIAYSGSIARVPWNNYLYQLSKKEFEGDDVYYLLEGRSLISEIRSTCSSGLQLKFDYYLGNSPENWAGLFTYLEEADVFGLLTFDLSLYKTLSLARSGKAVEAVGMLCLTLNRVTEEEFKKGEQNMAVCTNILNLAIAETLKKYDNDTEKAIAALKSFHKKIDAVQLKPSTDFIKKELLKEINEALIHREIGRAIKGFNAALEKNNFDEAKRILETIQGDSKEIKDIKSKMSEVLEERTRQFKDQKLIETAVKEAKRQVEQGQFEKAKATINQIPDRSTDIRELKKGFIKQIDESQKDYALKEKIDQIVGEVRECLSRADFQGAKKAANKIPDQAHEIRANIIGQITELEIQLKNRR